MMSHASEQRTSAVTAATTGHVHAAAARAHEVAVHAPEERRAAVGLRYQRSTCCRTGLIFRLRHPATFGIRTAQSAVTAATTGHVHAAAARAREVAVHAPEERREEAVRALEEGRVAGLSGKARQRALVDPYKNNRSPPPRATSSTAQFRQQQPRLATSTRWRPAPTRRWPAPWRTCGAGHGKRVQQTRSIGARAAHTTLALR